MRVKGLEKTLADVTSTLSVVVCNFCGEHHPIDSRSFVVLYGDVREGLSDENALIAGNVDDRGKLTGSTIFCKKHEFVKQLIDAIKGTGAQPKDRGEDAEV